MEFIDGIFYVLILIMSVVVHEFAHGYTAYLLGDQTARLSGRLTLNPLKHLDPFGSVILPLVLVILNAGFVIGWARPVPYNPNNLNNPRRGTFLVAISGVLANIIIAVLFGLLIRFAYIFGLPAYIADPLPLHPFYKVATMIVFVNLVLSMFNLIPIPPLDGSKVLFSFLPPQYRYIETFLTRWGIFLMLFFIVFIWGSFVPVIIWLFSLITGIY
jgi:Zn-dependent protease